MLFRKISTFYYAGFLWLLTWAGFSKALQENVYHQSKERQLQLFVVDDSMNDNGNINTLTRYILGKRQLSDEQKKLYPFSVLHMPSWMYRKFISDNPTPTNPYSGGGYSNGLVTADRLAQLLNIDTRNSTQYQNIAHGSATATKRFSFSKGGIGRWVFTTPMDDQWSFLAKKKQTFRRKDILLLGGGYNDYREGFISEENIKEVVSIKDSIAKEFLRLGGGIVVLGTLGDLTMTPCYRDSPYKDNLKQALIEHNKLTREKYKSVQSEDLGIIFIDYDVLLLTIKDEFDNSGFDTRNPCFKVTLDVCTILEKDYVELFNSANAKEPCGNPKQHMYCDVLHFGYEVHAIIAAVIRKEIGEKGEIEQDCLFERGVFNDKVNRVYAEYKARLLTENDE
ncbi:hypothetical protein ACH42_13910 [Endozoicomonas sp. (ex Bugula neritina AB1)]|nr:hypothetical protein ACH42_13910 [Endozoicomonas sp. (ex Bugula neritina AB1)]